jgi:sodium/potassium/calcium exchanger 6
MQQNVMTMNERSILDTVQRWRRTKYSARPFALTILAISLITLLAWAREQRSEVPDSELLRKRDVTIFDEEVHHIIVYYHPSY